MTKYTCANCKKEFEGAWTEEEANLEAQINFNVKDASQREDYAVICDNCYKKLGLIKL